ncbi:hypothetical protein, partial [Leclercia adecarboxylata]|uniref:hypothetical protein n=1 Tax=Leclercia adecarboxylata TaxID=83655 RepID=UPI003017D201
FITVSVGMVLANRCHRQNMKTSIINGSEVSRLSVAIHYVTFVYANSAPEESQFKGRYFLILRPDFGLTSISFSKGVDPTSMLFDEGKKVYDSISAKLEQKYGKPSTINEHMDRDGTEFYDCLRFEDCGKWERNYVKDGMSITLKMSPISGDLIPDIPKAYVNVEYEYFTEEMKQKDIKQQLKKYEKNNF